MILLFFVEKWMFSPAIGLLIINLRDLFITVIQNIKWLYEY